MIKLSLLVGSASYGLQIDGSDTDVYIVGSGSYLIPDGAKPHIIKDDKESFVEKALLKYKQHPFYLQCLFFGESLLETDAKKYILNTREEVIRANLRVVYSAYFNMGKHYLDMADCLYASTPKRIAYGLLFLDTIYRYADGCSFAEAFRPEKDFRSFLLRIRKQEASIEDILRVADEKKNLAESVALFYDKDADLAYLDSWSVEMLNLLSE